MCIRINNTLKYKIIEKELYDINVYINLFLFTSHIKMKFRKNLIK